LLIINNISFIITIKEPKTVDKFEKVAISIIRIRVNEIATMWISSG
jgi:hypothetical protein